MLPHSESHEMDGAQNCKEKHTAVVIKKGFAYPCQYKSCVWTRFPLTTMAENLALPFYLFSQNVAPDCSLFYCMKPCPGSLSLQYYHKLCITTKTSIPNCSINQ